MTKLFRGKKLVDMCHRNQQKDEEQCNVDITLRKNAHGNNDKKLLGYHDKPMRPLSPNYDKKIWTRSYSLTTPVFKKFNEFQTTDLKSIDKVISNQDKLFYQSTLPNDNSIHRQKEKSLEAKQKPMDLMCYEDMVPSLASPCEELNFEDFDSDDSVKDKDYVPSIDISQNNSDSEDSNGSSAIYLPATVSLPKSVEEDILQNNSDSEDFDGPSSIYLPPTVLLPKSVEEDILQNNSDSEDFDGASSIYLPPTVLLPKSVEEDISQNNSGSEDFDGAFDIYLPPTVLLPKSVEEDISQNNSGSEDFDGAFDIYLPPTVLLPKSFEEEHFEVDTVLQQERVKESIINKTLNLENEFGPPAIDKKNGSEEINDEVIVVIVIEEEHGNSLEKKTQAKNSFNNEFEEKYFEKGEKADKNYENREKEEVQEEINKEKEVQKEDSGLNDQIEKGTERDNGENEGEEKENEQEKVDTYSNTDESSQLYTKSGSIRKRKTYDTSFKCRQEAKRLKYRENFNVKEGCNDNCIKKCKEKVNEDTRKEINENFWKMTWKERRIFLRQSSCIATPNRRISSLPQRHPRRLFYFKMNDERKIFICKTFFLTTLGFKPTNDRVLYNALNAENSSMEDRRGKNLNTNFVNRDIITKHIESFNPTISHYRREHAPNRKYLPSDITVKIMHEDFSVKHPNVQISYDLYRKHLKSLNISFTRLGNEECEICEAHHIHCQSESHDKENIPDDCQICKHFMDHKIRSVKSRKLYNKHKDQKDDDSSHIYFSTDLEKVIMLPRLEAFKEVLFCQRVVAYNQTFAPLGKSKNERPYAVLWHEAIAGRKQQDIISAFKSFFQHSRDHEYIDLWLDNCSAQNKNWLLYFYIIDLINSDKICAKQITFNYFETGHTYMSCDHFHHQVELAMKKKGKLYDFQDFVEAVTAANSRKVTVKEMHISDFIDISDHTSNRRIQTSTPRVYMRDIVQVTFKRGKQNIFYKTDLDGEIIEVCFIKDSYLKPKNGPISVLATRQIERGIKTSRKDNILKKLSKLMPPHKLAFWENIPTGNEGDD